MMMLIFAPWHSDFRLWDGNGCTRKNLTPVLWRYFWGSTLDAWKRKMPGDSLALLNFRKRVMATRVMSSMSPSKWRGPSVVFAVGGGFPWLYL